MQDVTDWAPILGSPALTPLELQARLAGIPSPSDITAANLKAWVDEAAVRESQFDSQGAAELHERIWSAYRRSPLQQTSASEVVARSSHDTAAWALADGKTGVALKLAIESLRRFPSTPLDARRHPPQVDQLFKRATLELRRAPTSLLTVHMSRPGRVVLDGVTIGHATTELTSRVLVGDYMMWLEGDDGRSLSRPITIHGPTDVITIDLELEEAITWSPVPTLRCAADCDAVLRRLAQRAGVDRVVGLELSGTGRARATYVGGGGTAEHRDIAELSTVLPIGLDFATLAPPPPSFSPLLLFPAGIGQFQQRRHAVGAAFAATELGLAVWHVIAISRYNGTRTGDIDAASSMRSSVNLSAGILIGAAVAGIGEAVIHHVIARRETAE